MLNRASFRSRETGVRSLAELIKELKNWYTLPIGLTFSIKNVKSNFILFSGSLLRGVACNNMVSCLAVVETVLPNQF